MRAQPAHPELLRGEPHLRNDLHCSVSTLPGLLISLSLGNYHQPFGPVGMRVLWHTVVKRGVLTQRRWLPKQAICTQDVAIQLAQHAQDTQPAHASV